MSVHTYIHTYMCMKVWAKQTYIHTHTHIHTHIYIYTSHTHIHTHIHTHTQVSSMLYSSPATVSRGGLVYMPEETDGWARFYESWVESRDNETQRELLMEFMEKYLRRALEFSARWLACVCRVCLCVCVCVCVHIYVTDSRVKTPEHRNHMVHVPLDTHT